MSVRDANGIGLAGALRRPQFLGAAALAAAIALIAVVIVAMQVNDGGSTTTSPRIQAPSAPALPVPSFNTVPSELPPTVYIVTSEAAAETYRRAIAEGDNIRANLGLSPSQDSVAVVANEAEAIALETAILEGNSILAGLGKNPLTVVRPIESSPANEVVPMSPNDVAMEHDNAISASLGQP